MAPESMEGRNEPKSARAALKKARTAALLTVMDTLKSANQLTDEEIEILDAEHEQLSMQNQLLRDVNQQLIAENCQLGEEKLRLETRLKHLTQDDSETEGTSCKLQGEAEDYDANSRHLVKSIEGPEAQVAPLLLESSFKENSDRQLGSPETLSWQSRSETGGDRSYGDYGDEDSTQFPYGQTPIPSPFQSPSAARGRTPVWQQWSPTDPASAKYGDNSEPSYASPDFYDERPRDSSSIYAPPLPVYEQDLPSSPALSSVHGPQLPTYERDSSSPVPSPFFAPKSSIHVSCGRALSLPPLYLSGTRQSPVSKLYKEESSPTWLPSNHPIQDSQSAVHAQNKTSQAKEVADSGYSSKYSSHIKKETRDDREDNGNSFGAALPSSNNLRPTNSWHHVEGNSSRTPLPLSRNSQSADEYLYSSYKGYNIPGAQPPPPTNSQSAKPFANFDSRHHFQAPSAAFRKSQLGNVLLHDINASRDRYLSYQSRNSHSKNPFPGFGEDHGFTLDSPSPPPAIASSYGSHMRHPEPPSDYSSATNCHGAIPELSLSATSRVGEHLSIYGNRPMEDRDSTAMNMFWSSPNNPSRVDNGVSNTTTRTESLPHSRYDTNLGALPGLSQSTSSWNNGFFSHQTIYPGRTPSPISPEVMLAHSPLPFGSFPSSTIHTELPSTIHFTTGHVANPRLSPPAPFRYEETSNYFDNYGMNYHHARSHFPPNHWDRVGNSFTNPPTGGRNRAGYDSPRLSYGAGISNSNSSKRKFDDILGGEEEEEGEEDYGSKRATKRPTSRYWYTISHK